jgi:hypothetical protein
MGVIAAGCGGRAAARPEKPPVERAAPAPAACVADELGVLDWGGALRQCGEEEAACKRDCDAGDATACWSLAAWRQQQPDDRLNASLYERACRLGHVNGCTNHAAEIWATEAEPERFACALRIFDKVCPAGDHFACGMAGRLRLERREGDDVTAGRASLERSCIALGGFPCRILAQYLEKGVLEGGTPQRIESLMAEACAGGDKPACGHDTVEPSFD